MIYLSVTPVNCKAALVVDGQCTLLGLFPSASTTVFVGTGTLRFIRNANLFTRPPATSIDQLLGFAQPTSSVESVPPPRISRRCTNLLRTRIASTLPSLMADAPAVLEDSG